MFLEKAITIELKFGVISFREIFIHRKGEGEREMCPLILRKWFGIQFCQTITHLAVKCSVRFLKLGCGLWCNSCFTCMLQSPKHNREYFCCFVFPACCYLCSTVQEACLLIDLSFWANRRAGGNIQWFCKLSESYSTLPPTSYLWAGKCFLKWCEHSPDLCVTLKCLCFPAVLTDL